MSEHVDLTEQYDDIAAAHRAGDDKKSTKLLAALKKEHPRVFQGENPLISQAMRARGAARHHDDEAEAWSYRFPT